MSLFLRVAGYFVATAIVDIAVDYWEVRKMRREMATYENSEGGRVSAHTVTEETAGAVMTVGGTGRDVEPGDVLIGTDRPDVYHVAGSDALDGLKQVDSDSDASDAAPVADDADLADTDADSDSDAFNPSDVSAAEVRWYLEQQREAGNRSEYDRVVAAERAGRNRSSAVVPFDR